MELQTGFDAAGGFVVYPRGVPRLRAYAYPSSTYATAARTQPDRVAREMMADEIRDLPTYVAVCGWDRYMERVAPRITSRALTVAFAI